MTIVYIVLALIAILAILTFILIHTTYRVPNTIEHFYILKKRMDKLSARLLGDCGVFEVNNLISYRESATQLRALVTSTNLKLVIEKPPSNTGRVIGVSPQINNDNFYTHMLDYLNIMGEDGYSKITEYVNECSGALHTRTIHMYKVVHTCKLTSYGFLETLDIEYRTRYEHIILKMEFPVYDPSYLTGRQSLVTHLTSYIEEKN